MPALLLPDGLADERVRLRPFVAGDAPAVFEACRDPLIRRFTSFPEHRGVADVSSWIEGQPGQRDRGEALDLAITLRDDDTVVGAVGLGETAFEHHRAAAGYWVAPGARGRGLAVAALRLLSGWAFDGPLGFVRLELHIAAENVASCRTAEGAGYAREGVLRSYMYVKGRHWDIAAYSLIADDRVD
ncbi:MAG TPA: GNAT family N-acetyltransferase [Baekduia sp.]|nr:GNAT family N-acetyltransferase [Baekduia sp.]